MHARRVARSLSIPLLLAFTLCSASAAAQQPATPSASQPAATPIAQPQPVPIPPGYTIPLATGAAGQVLLVTALAADPHGIVWVGTEDDGLWRFDRHAPDDARWQVFGTKDGLGSECVDALAIDSLGRVWAGHPDHGLSVYNGKKWQNYEVAAGIGRPDALAGTWGERVFAIAVSPLNGDVWMGTSAGLCRYSPKTDIWRNLGRADGLPSDQIVALAFDRQGRLFAGTACDGIAIGNPQDDYATWSIVKAPEVLLHTPLGRGIPSNAINTLLATHDGVICAGTPFGLAKSTDHGNTWTYMRGEDWAPKGEPARTMLTFKQAVAQRVTPAPWPASGKLAQDYVSALAEDHAGNIWVGTRVREYGILTPAGRFEPGEVIAVSHSRWIEPPVITAILPLPNETLIATYSGGLREVRPVATIQVTAEPAATQNATPETPPLPSSAVAPTPDTLHEMAAALEKTPHLPTPAVYEGEDWRTQGDWVGHYGKQYALLCSARVGFDEFVTNGSIYYRVQGLIGPYHGQGEGLRRWVRQTRDPHALWDPMRGFRNEAEWDDHGEEYPTATSGPDLNIEVTLPAGVSRVSLYFVNTWGRYGEQRLRDYPIEIRKTPGEIGSPGGPPLPGPLPGDPPALPRAPALLPPTASVPIAWYELPVLAHARVNNFHGGVYKVFDLAGPGTFLFTIRRDYSLNTILSGIFIDRLEGSPTSLDKTVPLLLEGPPYAPPELPADPQKGSTNAAAVAAAITLMHSAQVSQGNLAATDRLWSARVAAYRAAVDAGAPADLLENWRWAMRLWTSDDYTHFDRAMSDILAYQVKTYPLLHDGAYP